MALWDWLFSRKQPQVNAAMGMDDPHLKEYIRSGGSRSVATAMQNSAVLRCVDLISGSIGMLPLYVMRASSVNTAEKAPDHPLWNVLQHKPNSWQSPFEFKQLMQAWALQDGNAYAVVVRSTGRVLALAPVHPSKVMVEQMADWSLQYTVSTDKGSRIYPSSDILHIRGLSDDGITGISRVKQAAHIIETANQAQEAASNIFRNGQMVGGYLQHPNKLSPEAHANMRKSMEDRHAGASNAGRWMILEEGMKAEQFASTAQAAQLAETRAGLVEDIARMFGVPRPLMMVDDTSWGSGIEQLAILFVRFALSPWMRAWEEAIARTLLPNDMGRVFADFDERELLRGTLKDQGEFFARALGSGGHKPWMEANEVRELSGLSEHPDGGGLMPAGGTNEAENVPAGA